MIKQTIKLTPNKQGFITNWLISGLKQSPFICVQEEKHQIKYEQYLREVGIDDTLKTPLSDIHLGQIACGEHPWQYYYSRNNWFVDMSNTCTVPTKIEAYAVTELIVEEDLVIKADVWTYPAIDIWLGTEKVCSVKKAVYKPMQRIKVELSLKKGINRLFIRIQNVGVRDTRNIFGVQLRGHIQDVEVSLPDREKLEPILEAERWLETVKYEEGKILLNQLPKQGVIKWVEKGISQTVREEVYVIDDNIKVFTIRVEVMEQILERKFEIAENWKPSYINEPTLEQTHHKIYEMLGKVPYQTRDSALNFSVFHVLARYAAGSQTPKDKEYLLQDLKYIEDRVDCSDFLVVGFLRLMKNYELEVDLLETIKKTLLNYRYWMDEEGSDGMCFWSENHALMFNGSQMVAGKIYPEEIFLRSGRTGKEQQAIGEERCRAWLADIEANGFEEFISATYTAVTVVALLNIIDFGPEDIATRAAALMDKALELLSMHIFDGVIIGPQGRVYRDVIYPFKQSAQGLVHFINKELPTVVSKEGAGCVWLSCFATSKYKAPAHLIECMEKDADYSHISAHAEINIKKNKDYILTSVTSPREEEAMIQEETLIPFTTPWVKAMNTQYHGTTKFAPGIYGYQQHMWYAALASDCAVFVNHPGGTTDETHMRPGYWYGNGIFPAVKQKGNILGAIYNITEDYPIHFTHLYWPSQSFDRIAQEGHWLFGKKNEGYVGIWSSEIMVPHQDVLMDREYRVYSSQAGYVCRCSSKGESGNFEDFIKECIHMNIVFNKDKLTLDIKDHLSLVFIRSFDDTQKI
ncbi:MAG: hypothetical protein K0S71_1199 [Clostridia bacterium]|jgi:hypothetical protein|nr:hypothetical protein [Clostridia bacterium]